MRKVIIVKNEITMLSFSELLIASDADISAVTSCIKIMGSLTIL